MPSLARLNQDIEEKGKRVAALFERGGEDLDLEGSEVTEIRDLNDSITSLSKERDEMLELKKIKDETLGKLRAETEAQTGVRLPAPTVSVQDKPAIKSIGQIFLESEAFKSYDRTLRRGPVSEVMAGDMLNGFGTGLKTLMTTADWPFVAQRQPGILDSPLRRPMIADLIPQSQTDATSISYVEESTPTNGADFVLEGNLKPESAMTFTQKLVSISKIATLLPVTDEMLMDQPAIRGYVEQRLRLFIQLREENALVSGSGTAPEFYGLMNVPSVLSQAKGADPTPDAVYKAIVQIQTTSFLDPSGLLIHPLDWQDIALLRTADGIYIWGGPANPGPERIWGLPIIKTPAQTQNTAIVAAFDTAMQIFRRMDIALAVSDSHADYFARNQLAIRAEERLGFVVYRPSAVCLVTGI